MFDLLFIVSIAGTCIQGIKEFLTPTIPSENWSNKELYHKDLIRGVSHEQCMKNLKNGRYKQIEQYKEPHRDVKSGKIIIENCKLFEEDKKKYGVIQTYKWIEQGKYNLTSEELIKENKRIEAELKRKYNM